MRRNAIRDENRKYDRLVIGLSTRFVRFVRYLLRHWAVTLEIDATERNSVRGCSRVGLRSRVSPLAISGVIRRSIGRRTSRLPPIKSQYAACQVRGRNDRHVAFSLRATRFVGKARFFHRDRERNHSNWHLSNMLIRDYYVTWIKSDKRDASRYTLYKRQYVGVFFFFNWTC